MPNVSNFVEVTPSDSLFRELGNNNYDFKDLLSELIDNAIAARIQSRPVNVVLDFYIDTENKPTRLVIADDASGIAQKEMGEALSPAAKQTKGSLNEHGLGMKQAIASLGVLDYIATKVAGEQWSRAIKELRWGKIPVDIDRDKLRPFISGTEISVSDLNPIAVFDQGSITRTLVGELGARYRYYLRQDDRRLNLLIQLKRESGKILIKKWPVDEKKPVYFNPHTRQNQPVINRHPLKGNGWDATLTFGRAPNEDEFEDLGIEQPSKFDPYFVSLKKQGLDVLLQERVVLPHQLSELGIVESPHPSLNSVRGEINLIKGFSTAITKNSIIHDKNFKECIEEISLILNGQKAGPKGTVVDYLKEGHAYPERLPEALLRDRLKALLERPPYKKRTVYKEYDVGQIEGFVDILADNEVWEIKVEQAKALDTYQLLMYMDAGGYDKGTLVADGFSPGADLARKIIKKNHSKQIEFVALNDLAINQPPSKDERNNYF